MFVAYDDESYFIPCFSRGTWSRISNPYHPESFSIVCHRNKNPNLLEKSFAHSMVLMFFGEITEIERMKNVCSIFDAGNYGQFEIEEFDFMIFEFYENEVVRVFKHFGGDVHQEDIAESIYHGENEFNFVDMTASGCSANDDYGKMLYAMDRYVFDVLRISGDVIKPTIERGCFKSSDREICYALELYS